MKLKLSLLLLSAVLLTACGSPVQQTEPTVPRDQNAEFTKFSARFLEEFWAYNPDWGVFVGYYKYDDKLIIPTQQNDTAERAFIEAQLAALGKFDPTALSASNATDYALIENHLRKSLWYRDELRSHEWNPATYNVASVFGLIMNTDYKPLDERLLTISKRLDNVPAYYEAARSNIKNPTAEHTALAIRQNNGALGVFETTIPAKLAESSLSEEQKTLISKKLSAASKAIRGHIHWLENIQTGFANNPARDFRIGKALYDKKFVLDIYSGMTAEELYNTAVTEKAKLHANMISITRELWPKYFADTAMPGEGLVAVKQLIDHLSVRHVAREDFVDEIRRQMPIIQKFMDDNQLLDSDPTRPLVVRETPEYQRGFAGASVNAPGPYDATANTYYNVTPLDHYNEEQAESYLREYNHWILQVLNIHEAIPGHYTQLMHANKSPSIIKSVFGNGAMIEGWAVYSERMMLEAGYGDNEPEMWLMYSKWNLRVVINTILDYRIQVLGLQREDALDLLMNEGFQERTEAEGKWNRATVSQVQLTSYFSGYAGIMAFREELKNKMGDRFDLRTFHNKFLSYGNSPVPVIRKLMLEEWGLE